MPAINTRVSRMVNSSRVLLVALATVTFSACGDDEIGAPIPYTPVATTIDIADPGFVRDGDTITLAATVRDQRQRTMSTAPVQFSVTDTSIATIAPGNVFTALREGTTEIVAVAGAVQQRRPVTVVLHPATAIELWQPSYTLFVNAQQRIPVIVRGLGDRVLTGRPLTWQSSNPTVARVDQTGLVTAVAPGDAAITVNYGTLERRIPVQVAAYGTSYRIATIDGRPLPAVVYEEVITRDDGSQYTLVERLESGTVAMGDQYRITMTVAEIERTVLQGNVIDRVMRRRTVRDEGLLTYNWLDGSGSLVSTLVGGLSHGLLPDLNGPRVRFRLGGTDTIWWLGLRLEP
jgi:hypothetical protein